MHEIEQYCNDLNRYTQGAISQPLFQFVCSAISRTFESSPAHCLCVALQLFVLSLIFPYFKNECELYDLRGRLCVSRNSFTAMEKKTPLQFIPKPTIPCQIGLFQYHN